jgi:3-dehydroquinate dehydratase-2
VAVTILVVHGPNLNLLGTREPATYGAETLSDIDRDLRDLGAELGVTVVSFQSNHEGALIDRVQAAREEAAGIVINPGGYTHTSVALRDALLAVALPFVEIHLSNVHAREAFRARSYFSDVAAGVVTGFGADGYALALRGLCAHLRRKAAGATAG